VRTPLLASVAVAATLLLTACTGDSDSSGSSGSTKDTGALQDRLAAAKKTLDGAETIDISLATEKLPSGLTALRSAKGTGNHTPAFTGEVTVVTGGSSLEAEVIAVGGTVYAKTSFSPTFLTIDPASLKAPDPASLLAPDGGITEILVETEDLAEGDKSRDGKDVLTSITGTLPGQVVAAIIPSADVAKNFDVTYRLDEDDQLKDARLTGPFYPGGADVTYQVTLKTSDEPVTIEAPSRPGGE
jgi:lipoprotein LprG